MVRIGWRTSRRLVADDALQVEQVRPRSDDRDEAHDELFADRIDRRVGDLREVLLEIGEQRLRLARQRRDRRVGAHGARRFLALRSPSASCRMRDVFLGVAEGLLAIEQRQVGERRPWPPRPAALPERSGAFEPLAIGMACGQRRLDLVVRDRGGPGQGRPAASCRAADATSVMMSSSGIASTPISDAITMRSSLVTR